MVDSLSSTLQLGLVGRNLRPKFEEIFKVKVIQEDLSLPLHHRTHYLNLLQDLELPHLVWENHFRHYPFLKLDSNLN